MEGKFTKIKIFFRFVNFSYICHINNIPNLNNNAFANTNNNIDIKNYDK